MSKRRNLVEGRKYHYTYRITNIKEAKYYYGVRSCDCLPKEDIGVKYWSSTKKEFIKDQKQNPQDYKYKVIKVFGTRVEAVQHEIFLHAKFDVKLHHKFYNGSNQTSTNFDTTGMKFPNNNYRLNKTMMFYEETQKFISNEHIDEYISIGWVVGYLPKSKEHCENISKGKKGKPAHNKGISCSEEQKKKISITKTGKKSSKETCAKLSACKTGIPSVNRNRIKINNGVDEKFVDQDALDSFISIGWRIGVANPSSRASVTGKIMINNGLVDKYILIEEFDYYHLEGWIRGSFRAKKD